jgi:hypothetical protein
MAGSEQSIALRQDAAQFRLVIGGYNDLGSLWTAHAELCRKGLGESQLCAFRLADESNDAGSRSRMSEHRQMDLLPLDVSSASLFDSVGLADAASSGSGAEWMPPRQAEALWKHLKQGQPVLLAQADTPDQQVECSRLQLSHRPRFLYTFNFMN